MGNEEGTGSEGARREGNGFGVRGVRRDKAGEMNEKMGAIPLTYTKIIVRRLFHFYIPKT